MKTTKLFVALCILVTGFIFSACSSDELTIINQSDIRDQLSKLPLPTAHEIQSKLSASGPQKVAAVNEYDILSCRVLPLDPEYFEITENSATRQLQYYEIADGGRIKRQIQIAQTFTLKDGVQVDTLGWSAYIHLEGVGVRKCKFWFAEYTESTTVFFRGDDGLQLAYEANLYDDAIYLPPLANGKWQVQVETFNKGVWQTFLTIPYQITKADPEELFLTYDDIFKMVDPRENTVAIATVSLESLRGNFLFVCEDENENYYSQRIPINVSNFISFAIPFNPKYIYIWGSNGQQTEIDPGIEPDPDGLYRYNL